MKKLGSFRKSGSPEKDKDRSINSVAIDEFRQELQSRDPSYQDLVFSFIEIEDEEHAMNRYLAGEKYDVEKTFKKMSKSLDLFKESKSESFFKDDPDNVVGAPLSAVLSQFPYFFHRVDKEGNPVCYFLGGIVNLDAVNCLTDKDKLLPMALHLMMVDAKTLLLEDREQNPDREQMELFSIIDMKGLSMSNVSVAYVTTLASVIAGLGDMHPEMMNKWAIINTPSSFAVIWSIIKKFIPAHIVDNVKVFSSKSKAENYLQENISKENLVSNYGGDSKSFDEIFLKKGTNRDSRNRQIIHHFSLARSNTFKCDFKLDTNEEIKFTIYSRTESAFRVTLMDSEDKVIQEEIFNEKTSAPCNTVIHSFSTPGNYFISCTPTSWSLSYINFVLVGDVTMKENHEK